MKNVVLKDREVDFCVLGINYGFNVVINIIYLGIMFVVMEVSIEGILFIGFFLLDFEYDVDFEFSKFFIEFLMCFVLE